MNAVAQAELTLHQVQGIGPRLRLRLLECFGSARSILDATDDELLAIHGMGPKLVRSIQITRDRFDPIKHHTQCERDGIDIVFESDDEFPSMLREIPDCPALLYRRGSLDTFDHLAIAVVGTRHASTYGLENAARLAGSLAHAGFTVVSGLARGIDGAAHQAALSAGGRTIAVLGSGLLNIYPPEHVRLAEEIAAQGLIYGELDPLSPPRGGSFPSRNRIISGLCLGVVVVEASHRSGALITARLAMEQNREVFAVPGPITNRGSRGCHALIRDGARLVESIDDILEELGPLARPTGDRDGHPISHPGELMLNDQEKVIMSAIGSEPTHIDEIVLRTRLSVPRILSTLAVLETRHIIRRMDGATVRRA